MKNNKKEKCDECGKTYNLRTLVIVKGKSLCFFCRRSKAKNIIPMNFPSRIPKSYIPPKLKVREKIVRDVEAPKIKGEKKTVGRKVHLYLSTVEKRFLWGKFVKGGMSPEEADRRVDFIVMKMKELAKKIRAEAQKKPITDVQMNQMFLEGLARWSV